MTYQISKKFFSSVSKAKWFQSTVDDSKLSALKSLNNFEILGLSICFKIEEKEVKSNFKMIQKQIHPDINPNFEELSSQVNEAKNTLLNPLLRGKYLLKLNEFEVDEEETMKNPEFLMNEMEKREELESLSTLESIEKFVDKERMNYKLNEEKLENLFKLRLFSEALSVLNKMKYSEKALEEAKTKRIIIDTK